MHGNGEQTIRRTAVAGMFYPQDPHELREAIRQAFLSPLGPGKEPAGEADARSVFGVVAPHAGYPYSAQGAAWAFAEVARSDRPQAVVLLGVNHRGVGAPIALSPASGWETPLGVLPVATEIGARLCQLYDQVIPDARAHQLEHSLEVQAPFIQVTFGVIPIVPIVISQISLEKVELLGRALATLAGEYELLFIASSDLSHYLPADVAGKQDQLALDMIAAVDPAGLVNVVTRQRITMCGVLPVATMLTAAKASGVHTAKILHYHTSGDVTGDRQEVVGYGAAALYR